MLDGEETISAGLGGDHQCWMGRRPSVLDGEVTISAGWGGDPLVLNGEETH